MKTFIEYMNDSRAPRTPEEKAETEGLSKLFEEIGLDGDDLIRKRAREHPTFLLRCHWGNHPELEALKRFPEIAGKVLDFGCGTGHLTVMAAEEGYDIEGLDELSSAVSVAKFIASKSKASPKFYLFAEEGRYHAPQFDSCWMSHVLEHFEASDVDMLVLTLKGWLKKTASILIAVPLRDAFPDPDHKHRWENEAEFVAYLSKWLKVVRSEEHTDSGCLRALCQFKD